MHCMVAIQNSGPPQLTTGSIPPNTVNLELYMSELKNATVRRYFELECENITPTDAWCFCVQKELPKLQQRHGLWYKIISLKKTA